MILESIFNLIKAAVLFVLDLLPAMDFLQIPTGFMVWFTDIIATSAYFLPLTDFLIMFGIWLMVTNFEIIWRTLMRIWDALPFT